METCSWEVTLVRVESGSKEETAAALRRRATALLERPDHVILDLRASVLDSLGLSALLSLKQRLELQGRRLVVLSTDPDFLALLDRAGVRASLPLFPTAEEALGQSRLWA
jgi:anti-anti-sigma factor